MGATQGGDSVNEPLFSWFGKSTCVATGQRARRQDPNDALKSFHQLDKAWTVDIAGLVDLGAQLVGAAGISCRRPDCIDKRHGDTLVAESLFVAGDEQVFGGVEDRGVDSDALAAQCLSRNVEHLAIGERFEYRVCAQDSDYAQGGAAQTDPRFR
ncbi:hypothetical protein [Nocardia sp. NPDC057440]|uniref:hypothetical protein n=1 Tax=Nocardia sp. NPDC057440 TaxID=3346134 RepID=UPI00366D0B02